MQQKETDSQSHGVAWKLGISLLLFALGVGPFLFVLGLPFTGIDAIPTVSAGSVASVGELPSVLLRELRGGIAPSLSYYRPLTLITYSFDSLLWGWNPLGYHLSDLFLHGMAVVAVFWMARIGFGLGPVQAFLVALLFLLHPVANEVVPAISRRQEPILMIGIALTLIGGAKLPTRPGWLLAGVGVAAAILAVERGLIVPGFLLAYLLLVRLQGEGIRFRLSRSLAWSLPFFGASAAFYTFRWALFGDSGIQFTLSNLLRFPIRYTVAVVYPEQLVDLRWPGSLITAVLALLAVGSLGGVFGWRVFRSRHRGLLTFSASVILLFGLMLGVAGQLLSWYPYLGAAFFALFAVVFLDEALERSPHSGRRAPSGLLTGAALGVVLLILVVASPVLGRYSAWTVAGEEIERITSGVPEIASHLPPGTGIALLNIPSHFRENASDFRVTWSAAMLWPYSLQPWLDAMGVRNRVVIVGTSTHTGVVRTPTLRLSDTILIVAFPGEGSSYSVGAVRWPPEEFGGEPFRALLFDGTEFLELPELSSGGTIEPLDSHG